MIARLDPAQLQQQKLRDKARWRARNRTNDQLKTTIEYQQATIDSDCRRQARRVERSASPPRRVAPAAVRRKFSRSSAAVNEARAQMDCAKSDWERAQTLYKNTDISTSQFDQARNEVRRCQGAACAGRGAAALMKGPRKEEIAGARADSPARKRRCARPRRIASNCGARSRNWWRAALKSTGDGRRWGSPRRS